MNWRTYVISARRAGNVPRMQAIIGDREPLTWVVPAHEAPDYRLAGAASVLGVTDPAPPLHALPAARNAALDNAAERGVVCIQTDDDLRSLHYLHRPLPAPVGRGRPPATAANAKRRRISWAYARNVLLRLLDDPGARLAGVNPTSNILNAANKAEVTRYGFVLGSLCAIDTRAQHGPPLPRWDETLPLKEDYDYTCAHLAAYGQVALANWVVPDYAHYSNRGGAVTARDHALEMQLVGLLCGRWPDYLRPHPRRAGEISFTNIRGRT